MPSPCLADGTLVQVEVRTVGGRQAASVVGAPLARANSPQAEVYAIAARHGLDSTFSAAVKSEVAEILRNPGIDDPKLKDLTKLPFVTIDNDDSKDLDQAMYISRRQDGGCDIYYALADASYYVRPGTALFAEALHRSSSYYLPGLCVPMLPKELSEGIVSLNEGVNRRALVFKMSLDKQGNVLGTTLERARIKSAKQLSFNNVQGYYDNPATSLLTGHPYTETLDLLAEVGKLRIAEAKKRDVINYQRTEVKVELSGGGTRFSLLGDNRNDVEKYNEQVSLLCNVEGARFLMGKDGKNLTLRNLQGIFRVHPPPPAERLDALKALIDGIVSRHKLDPKVWSWRRDKGESLADYLDGLPEVGTNVRFARVIERQAMISNMPAQFEEQPGVHYGIGAPAYARFSSPMREMVGIFTHKEALELLEGHGDEAPSANDAALRDQIVCGGNAAKATEGAITREANKIAIDALFADDARQPAGARPLRRGTIMGITPTKVYVQLDDPPIEVKLYPRDLKDKVGLDFRFDNSGLFMTAGVGRELELGGQVDLRVVSYDDRTQHWILEPIFRSGPV